MSGRASASFRIGVLLAVGAATGCDNMPWSSKPQDQGAASAALTTAETGIAPSRPAVPPAEVLATVNKSPISKADVELRIQELKTLTESVGEAWAPLTPEQREAVLEELVNTELMNQDAAARGLDRTLTVQQRWDYLRRGFFAQEWMRWNQERASVSSEDVDTYYEENKAGFREPQQLRLRELVIGSEEQAKQALAQLHGGTVEFEALARQISAGPTASQGGLLSGLVMRANEKSLLFASDADASAAGVISLDPTLEAAAFAIDRVGGLSNYVKGADDRYHIFSLVELKAERQRDKTELWDDIKNFLTMQKLQSTMDELRTKAVIERFPDRLEGVTP